jgi:methylase of polypeptide subunit release factors
LTTGPHLAVPDSGALEGVRGALARVGYTEQRVRAALGPRPPLPQNRREVHLRRLSEAGELGTLIRLFRVGETVDRVDAERAFAGADLDALVDAGLLEQTNDVLSARVKLTPALGLILAHDRADTRMPASWHVILGSASRTLAALTTRVPVESALDLGTGCGVQALLAAAHAKRVVATDVSERALTFGRINAALNGIENVEWRQGDLFAPVADERFGLVVSNPPFVVSPDTGVVFRDSEMPGDEISRHVVREAGAHLEDGGHATILCSWICPTDDDWSVPLRRSVAAGCDAILLQFTSARPLAYAAMWTEELERWLRYYREEGIEWISTGAAILRRRPPGGHVVAYQATGAPRLNASDQLLRIFAAHDDLSEAGSDDERLLEERFRLVGHRLRQEATYRDGSYTVELTGVEIDGSPLNVRVETDALHSLARLDGPSSLREVIDRAARETGLDRDQIARATLTTVRRLYERGFLVREG